MMLSHSGVLMLAIGVFLNAFLKQDFEFIGKIGDSIKHADITISLQNIRYSSGPNYYRQIGEFWVDYKGEITILKPENRLYKVENSLSAESDIYSFIPYDIYAVLGNVEKDNTMHANIYIRPWMSLIWGGMALVAIGIVLGISRETHRSPLKNAK
jgi:cytochrome c-type biogenesis protein CcmF